jgi:hypothetical protein
MERLGHDKAVRASRLGGLHEGAAQMWVLQRLAAGGAQKRTARGHCRGREGRGHLLQGVDFWVALE